VAAEASNFLMGRTFLDIDMARAADLLGMERRQAEVIRDLERGHFLALGPAVSRRPIRIRIGEVKTAARSGSPKLVPLPAAGAVGDMESLLLAPAPEETPPPPPPPPPAPVPADDLIRPPEPSPSAPSLPKLDNEEQEAIVSLTLKELTEEPGSAFQPIPALYQDFGLRCRMRRLATPPLDLPAFRKRLAMARAGLFDARGDGWEPALAIGAELPEDMLAPFLLVARAAREAAPCPADEALAEAYGTSSPARVRRLLGWMEERQIIVSRTDLSGKRSIAIPRLGWTTAPAAPETEPLRAAGRG